MKSPSKFVLFKRNPVLSTVAVLSMAFSANSYAAIATWNGGGTDNYWSDGANWGGTAPVSDNALIVNLAGTTRVTGTVDAPITLNSLIFTAGGGAFTLNGSDISLYGTDQNTPTLINNSTSNQIINNNITLLHASSIGIGTSSAMGNLTINGNINAGTYTLGFNNSQTSLSSGNHYLTINGVISGSGIGGVVIEEQLGSAHIGHTVLNGVNTYTGPTTIFDGIVLVGTDSLSGQNGAFGNSTSPVSLGATTGAFSPTILTNGAYTIGRNIQIRSGANTVTLGGATANISNYSGNITMGDASGAAVGFTATAVSGGRVNFSGNLTRATGATGATDTLTVTGGGVVALSGTNTYTGATTVSAGTLIINGNNTAATGAVAVNGSTTLSGTGTIGGAVTLAGGTTAGTRGTISLVDGSIDTLTLGSGLTIGNGGNVSLLNFDVGAGADKVAVGGVLTLSGTGYISLTQLAGITNGNYNLLTYASKTGSGSLTFSDTTTTSTANGRKFTLGTTATAETLNVTDTLFATTYNLGVSAGASRIMTGQSTPITLTITNTGIGINTGSGVADTLSYTGLAGSATAGSFSGGAASGGPLANANTSGTSTSQSFVGGATGIQTITPVVTAATNATLTGAASLGTSGSATVTVVDNRVVTADSISYGRVMKNQVLSGTSTLRTTGDNDHYTAVTVNGQLFNSAATTSTYTTGTSFASTGIQGGTITLTTTGEGVAGEAPINVGVGYSATALDNRVVTADSISYGRVMKGQSLSGTSTLRTTGDNNHYTAVTVHGQLFNSAATTSTYTTGTSFASTGIQGGTITLTTLGEGVTGEAPINVGVGYSATALDNRLVTADSISYGRVMKNQILSGTSTLRTTGDNDHYTAVTVNGQLFNSGATTSTYTTGTSFASTGIQSGATTLTTTGEGVAGEAPINVNVGYSATAVDNRVVSASAVNFGNVLVGYTASGTSTLSTTGDSDHYTTIKVDAQTFNGDASTGTHSVSKTFGTSGSKSGSDAATVVGEGLAGEAPVAVNAGYSANVFQAASLSSNGATLSSATPSADLTLINAASSDSGQRAGVTVTGLTASNSNFTTALGGTPSVGNASTSDIQGTVGTVSLGSDRLNGVYAGIVTAASQYTDTALRSQGNVSDTTLSVNGTITDHTSAGKLDVKKADIANGGSYGGYGLTSGLSNGTIATIKDGQASAATTVQMSYVTPVEFADEGKTDSAKRAADILRLSGIAAAIGSGTSYDGSILTDQFVLQISYTGSQMGYVAWYDGVLNQWVNAIAGNSTLEGGQGILGTGVGYGHFYADTSYTSALDVLGNYGYDASTNTAWAVVDHNSDYTVVAVPEPSTWTMIAGGLGILLMLHHVRRRTA